MPSPVYTSDRLNPAFHLRYTWTGWPTAGSFFPPQPGADFFTTLDAAWQADNLRRLSTNWCTDLIQFTFSALPSVSPTVFVGRVKGRLQHTLRLNRTPVKFSRKVAYRGIGDNHSQDLENYIQRQVDKESFVDPGFSEMLARFTTIDASVALNEPTETNSGRYWYNLHVVLVVAARGRIRSEEEFTKLDRSIHATANKHGYGLAVRAWMPDHLHIALRGSIEESPEEIAMSFMNNTAYAMGQNAIWQPSFYVGTFSEYDMRAVRRS